MGEPFVGSEAVAKGDLTKSALRTRYTRIFRDVYAAPGTELTPLVRARAGWLWSGRRGIVAGKSASAMYGAKWVDPDDPLELIHGNRNPLTGLLIRGDRVEEDEVGLIDGVPVTTPVRTALDLACWYPLGAAVAAVDALARAVDLNLPAVRSLAERTSGRRGIRGAREALELVDAGSQSPRETRLRLWLVQAGLPVPQTQIPVYDDYGNPIAYLDMGWPELKVAVEYDGEQHRTDRSQYRWDVQRREMLERQGWILIRVLVGDRRTDVIRRVRAALAQRTSRQSGTECAPPLWRDARGA